ncbi:hypothetical protein AB0I81_17130 [Nonomuraea sp. NPDC050404]|uniref:hypothetical protein n=1 Tax=Nonomuraea sp. NPDC050404 TaxID=3155783 RepID=UPI00340E188D
MKRIAAGLATAFATGALAVAVSASPAAAQGFVTYGECIRGGGIPVDYGTALICRLGIYDGYWISGIG